jgi:hypothetical protein
MSDQNNKSKIVGKIRMQMGFCPRCNSDAPGLYECPVCQYKQAPKHTWYLNFLKWRNGEEVPTYGRPLARVERG